jgi:hypothetical protein
MRLLESIQSDDPLKPVSHKTVSDRPPYLVARELASIHQRPFCASLLQRVLLLPRRCGMLYHCIVYIYLLLRPSFTSEVRVLHRSVYVYSYAYVNSYRYVMCCITCTHTVVNAFLPEGLQTLIGRVTYSLFRVAFLPKTIWMAHSVSTYVLLLLNYAV